MTKRALILGASLVTVFALSIIMTPAFSGGHLAITETEAEVDDGELEAEIEVTADIPTDGSASAFGYGIITDGVGANNVLALTTHSGVLDHPFQTGPADPVFHAHVLDLATLGAIANPCIPAAHDAVVDFASSLGSSNNVGALYEVDVDDEEIEVEDAPVTDLNDATVEGFVAFTITGIGVDPNAPAVIPPIPWLCLDIVGVGVGL